MTRVVTVILGAWILEACSTVGVCSYDLTRHGWRPDPHPPSELQSENNRVSRWYVNDAGDRFACPDMDAKHVCGNVYEIYRKKERGYEPEEIVCMT